MKSRTRFQEEIWQALEERGWVTPLSKPSEEFIQWWKNHDHAYHHTELGSRERWTSGISADKAWMVADYRDEFNVRGHEFAAGTGVNYTNHGWFRPNQKPMMSNPAILAEHRQWCKEHGRPDPLNA